MWQILATSNLLKNDKVLVQKLREMKVRHAEIIASMQGGMIHPNQILLPEEEANVQKECVQLKRDLEFCRSEIDRLRAKLVIDDDE